MVPICLYCLNCTKFGQLFLRNIIKIVATRCQILRLKHFSDAHEAASYMFFELSIVLLHNFYNITECCFVTVVSEVFTLY